jgi:hypothetical protein
VILVVLMPAKRATEPELMYLCTRMPRYNINAHHAPIATVPVFRTLKVNFNTLNVAWRHVDAGH